MTTMQTTRFTPRRSGRLAGDSRGFAIPLALVVLVTLGFVGAAAAFMTTGDTRVAGLYGTSNRASAAASAGIEHGVANFQENGSAVAYWPLEATIDGFAYAVTLPRDSFDFDGDGDREPVSCKISGGGSSGPVAPEDFAPPDWRIGYEAKDPNKDIKYAWKTAYKEDAKDGTDEWKVKFEEKWHVDESFDVDAWATDSAWVDDRGWFDDASELAPGHIHAQDKWEISFDRMSESHFKKEINSKTYESNKTTGVTEETEIKRTEEWKQKSGVWTITITEDVRTVDSNKKKTTKWIETATDDEAFEANNWDEYKYGQAAADKPKGTGDTAWKAQYDGKGERSASVDGSVKIALKWKDQSPNLDRRDEFKSPFLDVTGAEADKEWWAKYMEDGTNASGSVYKLSWQANAPDGMIAPGNSDGSSSGGNGNDLKCTLNGKEQGQPVYVMTSAATRGQSRATQRLTVTSVKSYANPVRLAWRAE
ncbi:MAG: hypothetical protein ABR559_07980 [Gemmatimonadota bacterium]